MTDKELLERAARAAGYCQFDGHARQMVESGWNPLEDDGDAFRLMVKLRLACDVALSGVNVVGWHGVDTSEELGGDPLSATRRAIVRAAAAMAN